MARRCDETAKRIQYCEEIFKDYQVEMQEPETLKELEHVIAQIQTNKRTVGSKLFHLVEDEMIKQENFLKSQKRMIDGSMNSFRSLICQVNVLNSVARVFGFSPKKEVTSDNELQKTQQQKSA